MIKRIKICDFKSIRELDLELDPVTVLVGRSGTGKSNVVQAIRFLRNLLLNHAQAIEFEGGWHRIVPAGERFPKTSIEVVFSMPGEDRDFNYRVTFGVPPKQPFERELWLWSEHLAVGGTAIFSRSQVSNKGWDWEKVPELAMMPAQIGSPMLGSFPALQKVVFAHAALSTGIGYYHFPSTTLGRTRNAEQELAFLSAIPGLSDQAANYLQIMRGITQDFHRPNLRKNLLASLQAVNPSIVSVELDSMATPQRAVVGHAAAGHVFELSLEQ
jgi:hypothetical protein